MPTSPRPALSCTAKGTGSWGELSPDESPPVVGVMSGGTEHLPPRPRPRRSGRAAVCVRWCSQHLLTVVSMANPSSCGCLW
eukprot:scaffold742_cov395-Prasinococcus_capsulatus_cf.AAC.2